MTKLIIMTQKELSRYEIIKRLIRKEINGTQAAKQMNLSVRQVKNIKSRVIKEGEKGVIHKSRGRVGNRRIDPEVIEEAKYWLKERYYDFQPTFASEKLERINQIRLSKEKVRQLMIEIGLWKVKPTKGRIERLWHTLQHRLVREMRLAGIKTVEEANRFVKQVFISQFNAQFSVVPAKKGNLHRKLTKIEKEQLDSILSHQETRIVNNDFTIRYKRMWFQLLKEQPVLVRKKEKVLVEERTDDSICITLRGKYLDYTVLLERPKKIIESRLPALPARRKSSWKPPTNHPWRRPFLIPKNKVKQPVSVD